MEHGPKVYGLSRCLSRIRKRLIRGNSAHTVAENGEKEKKILEGKKIVSVRDEKAMARTTTGRTIFSGLIMT